jgi:hypothetical protein
MALAAYGGLEAMNSAETKPKELRLGKPCAGKPLARFDEGEGSVCGLPLRCALYSTTLYLKSGIYPGERRISFVLSFLLTLEGLPRQTGALIFMAIRLPTRAMASVQPVAE